MEIETTISLYPDNKKEPTDKEYWLKCYRANRAIKALNKISADIVMGRLYPDDDKASVIHGFAWNK